MRAISIRRPILLGLALTLLFGDAFGTDIVVSSATSSTQSPGSGDTLSVTTAGSITVTGTAVPVNIAATGVGSITNAGVLTSSTSGSTYGIFVASGGQAGSGIVNSGTIIAGRTAIGNNRGAVVSGTINGGIQNTGLVQTTGFGNNTPSAIGLPDGFTLTGGITNGTGGVIESLGSGDQNAAIWIGVSGNGTATTTTSFSGGIDNSGRIESVGLNAIRIAGLKGVGTYSGDVMNRASGSIINSGASAWGAVLYWNTATSGNLDNSGVIRGWNGAVVRLGSTFTGDVLNRAGGIISGTSTNASANALWFDVATLNGNVVNAGSITGGAGATSVGIRTGAAFVTTGSMSNAALVSGNGNSIVLSNTASAFTFLNTGTLSGNASLGINSLTLQGASARVIGTTTGSSASVVNVGGPFASEGTFSVGTFNVLSGGTFTMNNDVTVGAGGLNNAGRFVVTSGSSVSVTANNGGLFHTGGSLVVNGTLGGATVRIDDGGFLGGSGTIQPATLIAGIHSPGNSPGLQTFGGDLTYQFVGSGPNVIWELISNSSSGAGTAFDQIAVGGNLSFSGATTLDLSFDGTGSTTDWTNAFWDTNEQWLLYDVTGTTTGIGSLSISPENWLDSNGKSFTSVVNGSFGVSQVGSKVYLNYTFSGYVPEIDPAGTGSVISLVLGSLGLLERRRVKAA